VAGDIGVKTMADLKGKRVAWVKGAPALNHNVTAMMACAGLTWDDVEKVEFAGFGASWTGILNNQADAAFSITVSGAPKQVAASPRGLVWPPQPHDDDACWSRMMAIAPYFTKNVGTSGSGISKDAPHVGMAYPYPVLTVYADAPDELSYSLAKGLDQAYDLYKDGAPGAAGWAMANQTFAWAVPYHEGAIAYFKEAGVWSAEEQKHNDALIARQKVLIDAWNAYVGSGPSDDDAFKASWLEARAKALTTAGLDVIFN
jgi:TRAP transporter TAXI family solute receptor